MKATQMKPQKTDTIPDGDYIYELKYDGGSAFIVKEDAKVSIYHSNNGTNQSWKYPELKKELLSLKNGVYVAEICCQSQEDIGGNFTNFLKRQCENKFIISNRAKKFPVTAMIYDIVELEGSDLTCKNTLERKKILSESVSVSPHVNLVQFYNSPEPILELAENHQIEGIVAKHVDSRYTFNKRTGWYKVRFNKEITTTCTSYEEWEDSKGKLKGIVLIDENQNDRYNLPGNRRKKAKQAIDKNGKVTVEVSIYGRRFPVVKRVCE